MHLICSSVSSIIYRVRISGDGFRLFSGIGIGSLGRLLSFLVDTCLISIASETRKFWCYRVWPVLCCTSLLVKNRFNQTRSAYISFQRIFLELIDLHFGDKGNYSLQSCAID